jgi:hypothetical protein
MHHVRHLPHLPPLLYKFWEWGGRASSATMAVAQVFASFARTFASWLFHVCWARQCLALIAARAG